MKRRLVILCEVVLGVAAAVWAIRASGAVGRIDWSSGWEDDDEQA